MQKAPAIAELGLHVNSHTFFNKVFVFFNAHDKQKTGNVKLSNVRKIGSMKLKSYLALTILLSGRSLKFHRGLAVTMLPKCCIKSTVAVNETPATLRVISMTFLLPLLQ